MQGVPISDDLVHDITKQARILKEYEGLVMLTYKFNEWRKINMPTKDAVAEQTVLRYCDAGEGYGSGPASGFSQFITELFKSLVGIMHRRVFISLNMNRAA